MKKILITGVVMIAVVISGLLAAQEAKGPKIEVKEVRYDLGKVDQGTQVTHVFEVRNAGAEPLIIEKVQTS